jgi:hypothetical protein
VAGLQLVIPHPRLCTDNGAMIAAAAYWRLHQGQSQLQGEALQSSMPRQTIAWQASDVLSAELTLGVGGSSVSARTRGCGHPGLHFKLLHAVNVTLKSLT